MSHIYRTFSCFLSYSTVKDRIITQNALGCYLFRKTSVTGCDLTHFRLNMLPASSTDNCITYCNARHSCLRRLEFVRLTDSEVASPYGQSADFTYPDQLINYVCE